MRIAKIIILLMVIILVAFSFGCYYNARKFSDTVAEISKEHNIDPILVLAICQAESGFDNMAVSSAGAIGIMQLLPSTAEWICARRNIPYENDRLYEQRYNIDLGAWYLNYLSYFDSRDWQIAAYNAGEGRVNNWIKEGITLKTIPYSETRAYLVRVNKYYEIFSKKKFIK